MNLFRSRVVAGEFIEDPEARQNTEDVSHIVFKKPRQFYAGGFRIGGLDISWSYNRDWKQVSV